MRAFSTLHSWETFFLSALLFLSAPLLMAQWNKLPDFLGGETDGSFSFVIGETAYVAGGLNDPGLYSWNKTEKSWHHVSTFPGGTTRAWSFAFSHNGKGYVGGGALNGSSVTNEFYEYNPDANTWTAKAPFGGGARDGCFAFVLGDKAYVGAGFDGQVIQFDVWEYDFTTNVWSNLGTFPGGAVLFSSAFVLNGKGYVVGGGAQTESPALFEFDPAGKTWTRKADFPGTPRQAGASFTLDGLGYYGGGMSGYSQTFQDFWTYDPTHDLWRKVKDQYPDQSSAWSVAFAVGGKGYVGTGASFAGQGIALTDHFYSFPYDPPAPTANLSATTLSFGSVSLGNSSNKSLTVTAGTAAGLEVLSIEFASPDAPAKGFSFTATPAAPATLPGLGEMTITVTFDPSSTGDAGTTLLIHTNDPANPDLSVAVSGTGVEMILPASEFSSTDIDFGSVKTGGEKALWFTIAPANSAGLEVSSLAILNANHSQHGFAFSASKNLPATLMQGESLEVEVRFNPQDTGLFTADLAVTTNASGAASTTVSLTGEGFNDDVMSVDREFSRQGFQLQGVPNATSGMLNLSMNLAQQTAINVRVIDMAGRAVITGGKNVAESGEYHYPLDLSGLPSGNYFVEVMAGNTQGRIKILKLP